MKYQLFDLTPKIFEELCYELLNKEYDFDKSIITDGPNDNGVDILSFKNNKKIAIQVKHKYKYNRNSLDTEIKRYNHLLESFNTFIFITSALIEPELIKQYQTDQLIIISQNELVSILDKHYSIAKKYFSKVEKKSKFIKRILSSSFAGLTISVISASITFFSTFFITDHENKNNLKNQIENVEQALVNIKELEDSLNNMKKEMIETDKKNKVILDEYKKMKDIEIVINEKKESLKNIINYEPWYMKLLSYFIGILIGIFTSIIGNILYKRWKLDKTLKN